MTIDQSKETTMRTVLVAVLLLVANVAVAGLSPQFQEWRRGPEQWLMTPDEQRSWKKLATDADAAAFIDLFWARRDPTPQTAFNEFRQEFLNRVAFADAEFREAKTRGALTDRGQVYILLGAPVEGMASGGWSTNQDLGRGGQNMSSGRAIRGAQLKWKWDLAQARALDVPKIEVAFSQRPGTGVYDRDVRRGQFSNVAPTAIRKAIVSPDLQAVPEWAERVAGAPRPAAADGKLGRVVLFADISALDIDAPADPLASLAASSSFAVDGELAWVVEYCGASDSSAPLHVTVGLRGRGARDAAGVEYDIEPAPMPSVPGCSVLRNVLPLSDLPRGSYELVVSLGGGLEAKRPFRIE